MAEKGGPRSPNRHLTLEEELKELVDEIADSHEDENLSRLREALKGVAEVIEETDDVEKGGA